MLSRDVDWSETLAPRPPSPPLSDVFGDRTARSRAIRSHVVQRAAGWSKLGLVSLGRIAPVAAPAVAGAVLGPLARRGAGEAPFVRRMRSTIARIDPALGEETAADAFLDRWFRNIARAMSEYWALDALGDARRLQIDRTDRLVDAEATGRPVIIMAVHAGTWELTLAAMTRFFGGRWIGPWQPQPDRYDNRIVEAARLRSGAKMIPPQPKLGRKLYAALTTPGGGLLLGIDEVSEGRIQFPLFGRTWPERGNVSWGLRVGRSAKALVIPTTLWREGGARNRLLVHEPIDMGETEIDEAAHRLNGIYEPFIRARLDQWYMLHKLAL